MSLEPADVRRYLPNLGPMKTCTCGGTYYGAPSVCPDCHEEEERKLKQQANKATKRTYSENAGEYLAGTDPFRKFFKETRPAVAFAEKMHEAFPDKDILAELKKASAWLFTHKRNYRRWDVFVLNWLKR